MSLEPEFDAVEPAFGDPVYSRNTGAEPEHPDTERPPAPEVVPAERFGADYSGQAIVAGEGGFGCRVALVQRPDAHGYRAVWPCMLASGHLDGHDFQPPARDPLSLGVTPAGSLVILQDPADGLGAVHATGQAVRVAMVGELCGCDESKHLRQSVTDYAERLTLLDTLVMDLTVVSGLAPGPEPETRLVEHVDGLAKGLAVERQQAVGMFDRVQTLQALFVRIAHAAKLPANTDADGFVEHVGRLAATVEADRQAIETLLTVIHRLELREVKGGAPAPSSRSSLARAFLTAKLSELGGLALAVGVAGVAKAEGLLDRVLND
jgi:hypothetical protein